MISKNYNEIAAARIKEARLRLRTSKGGTVSQVAFAKLIPGMKPARLGNYESGTRYPGPEVFEAIENLTGEPAAYLAGLVNDDAATMLRAFIAMDEHDKVDALLFVRRRKSLPTVEVSSFGISTHPEQAGAKHK